MGEENNFPIGAAYVYNVDSYCKLSFARRLVPTSTASVRFGCAVATLGDDRVVVGARGADFVYSANADSGSVFIFDLSNGQQTARLVPSDPYRCFWFGASVATMADVILVGAPRARNPCSIDLKAGAAWTFDASTYQQTAKLTSKAQKGDEFGSSVEAYREADGTGILLISSPKAANEHGVVHRFEQHRLDGGNVQTTWSSQIQGPVPLPGAAGSHFGSALTVDAARGLALIGASQMTGAAGPKSGGALLVRIEPWANLSSSCAQAKCPVEGLLERYLWGTDSEEGDLAGGSVALSTDGVAIIGAENHRHPNSGDQMTGGAYTFHSFLPPSQPPPSWPPTDSSNASAISQPQVIDVAIAVTLAIAGLAVLLTILMALFASRRILKSGAIGRRYRFLKRRLPTGAQRAVRMISSSRPGTTLTVFTPEVAAKTPQEKHSKAQEKLEHQHSRISYDHGDAAPSRVKEVLNGPPPPPLAQLSEDDVRARVVLALKQKGHLSPVNGEGRHQASRMSLGAPRVLPNADMFGDNVQKARSLLLRQDGVSLEATSTPLSPRLGALLTKHSSREMAPTSRLSALLMRHSSSREVAPSVEAAPAPPIQSARLQELLKRHGSQM